MKKIIAISYLFIFLCANTEVGQLLKLPNLIEHFTEHQNHERDISFFDFVKSHYNPKHKHSHGDKHDGHENLPFKTISTNLSTIIAFENQTLISFRKPVSIAPNNTVPFYKRFYISAVYTCIWLPPKLT